MKKFTEPEFEILHLDGVDIMTVSDRNDEGDWVLNEDEEY